MGTKRGVSLRFRAACRQRTGSPSMLTTCDFDTDRVVRDFPPDEVAARIDAYLFHMQSAHGKRPHGPRAVFPLRMWRMPKPKPFEPKPLGPGVDVEWFDHKTSTIRHGQVWAYSPSAGYRWVADGATYHEVHEAELRATAPTGVAAA